MNDDIKELTVRELLSAEEYRIPIYQRNYAWGTSETTQLIQDIADYAKDFSDKYYYIGNLIVFPRRQDNMVYYETIDGQQRSTTLTIIMCALKLNLPDYDTGWYKDVNISFDHRNRSNSTLKFLFNYRGDSAVPDDANSEIMNVYNKTWSIIEHVCDNKDIEPAEFADYLLEKVRILRISVPKDTNLNHYFEIMNSRGEQLEQHEIIKARLMSAIGDDAAEMSAFNLIWEACSNMDRYVRMSFKKDLRMKLFSDNGVGEIVVDDLQDVADLLQIDNSVDVEEKSLFDLFVDAKNNVKYTRPWTSKRDEEEADSYTSVVTFPNFLLHVLKIMLPDKAYVVLDDKRLSNIFETAISSSNDKGEFARDFIMTLLEVRCLFDDYIIKKKQEKWTLKRLSLQPKSKEKDQYKYYYRDTFSDDGSDDDKSGSNRKVIMLLSMFHLSFPSKIYKHWLYAALSYVYNYEDITDDDYADFLWNLAKNYMYYIYLPDSEHQLAFEDLERKEWCMPKAFDHIDWSRINIGACSCCGEDIQNFVFNFYDYLLWMDSKDSDFEFTSRTSVEHFYPQHPSGIKEMNYRFLQSFGNLCLVTNSDNSRFNNLLPKAKYDNYHDVDKMKTYSMKLKSMMNYVSNAEWNKADIIKEEIRAKKILENALK